ncbi:hypothetical protein [Labedaea rhizosphaerae]|uniref:DoxX-like protein n=1 Tax=Labedaea rhizosphaerae TaxID=598644 RepID=A0A4R6SKZ0_LABRH|nr:hypothetical protein [Labedaea rhizosphaerae]TDQ04230.1 hypothetical protein EV186_101172 [Labedaea rhizosphaerae]
MKGLLAVVLALVGAVAAAYGAFQPWQHGRTGTHTPLAEAFGAQTKATTSPATSAFVLIAIGIVLVVVSLARSKPAPMVLGALLILVPLALPLATSHLKFDDLQTGAYQVLVGGVLALIGAGLRS